MLRLAGKRPVVTLWGRSGQWVVLQRVVAVRVSSRSKLEAEMIKETSVKTAPERSSSPPTQLLLRNAARLTGTSALVAGLYNDDAVDVLTPALPDATFLTLDYPAYTRARAAASAGQNVLYSPFYHPPEPLHDLAIVYLQKGKDLNEMLLTTVARSVVPGGKLLLVGENTGGIRSSKRLLEAVAGPVTFSDAARHSVLYQVTLTRDQTKPLLLSDWMKPAPVEMGGTGLTLVSLPGVFSHGRVDKGTELLLEHLPAGLTGDVLDLGCGSGVIGALVKLRFPETRVTLTDSNALALAAAEETFRVNEIRAEAVIASDVYTQVHGQFDVILSNPPFHEGTRTQYETTSHLISGSAGHLRSGGQLLLVANHFLHYESIMEEHVGPVTCLARDGGYKVLLSRKR